MGSTCHIISYLNKYRNELQKNKKSNLWRHADVIMTSAAPWLTVSSGAAAIGRFGQQ
jgi:hypothetical protein